jgi:hypothetical protein
MKIILWMLMSLLFTVSLALGQASSEKPGHRTNTQIITYILDFQEKRVLGIAQIMPADKYSFAPSIGAFKGVRTFGEELKHIAADNYLLGAGILGEKPSVDVGTGESGSNTLRTKEQIIGYVKDSFLYMRRAATAIDDGNAAVPTPDISPWPAGTATRMGIAVEDCVHTWDHYGQLVGYLRMNNIVPPGSK